MPEKRKFDLEDENPNKLKRRKINDDLYDELKERVAIINELYLKLLKSLHNKSDYLFYENIYRNEEMDIVNILKHKNKSLRYMDKNFKLNHEFQILPLDKINLDEFLKNIEEIDEEETETDETYDPEEETNPFLKIFQYMADEQEEIGYEKLIESSNLSNEEKNKLRIEYKKIEKIQKNKIPDKLKVLQLDIPIEVKVEILDKMSLLDLSPHDDAKTRDWIRQVMKIPFGKFCKNPITKISNENVNSFLLTFHDTLNKAIYGQKKVKESLIEIITKWATNNSNKGQCIAIHGPAGVGKTTIIREGLSKALNRQFCSFSLAGVSDENYLTGFPFTYEGATCGRFAKMLIDTKCMNPIIFMDELDKVDTKRSMSIYNKLVEITDFSQNHEIEDHYFGSNIKLDMSKCIFVFSLNDINLVDPILRDRLEVITVDGFDNKQKLNIAKDFIIPKELKQYEKKYKFTDEIIKYIIQKVKEEKGVRNLKRAIEKILRKLNVLQYYNNENISYKMKNIESTITKKLIDKLLKDENKPNLTLLRMYM
jgi:ATP-dependent Lon protease